MIRTMENPFQFGRELGADELVNRIDELKIVHQTIEMGEKLFVIGPRRFGKTSLLKTAAEQSIKQENIILRYNAEGFAEIEQLVKSIVEDSAKNLRGKVERTGEQIKKYFKALRPEISFSVTQTEWKVALGVAQETRISPSSMRRSLESLTARDILRQQESKGSIYFRFEDPFFAHWIRLFTF